jgi:geranylgeranyl transferase type-1 subunit beta
MTYTALATLAILGDPLTGLDRRGIVNLVRATQQADGSFRSMPLGGETDLRFTYCACCVSRMLGDWSGVDIPRAAAFVRGSLSYEGALGQGPLLESHAGSTFCGVAALVMMVSG